MEKYAHYHEGNLGVDSLQVQTNPNVIWMFDDVCIPQDLASYFGICPRNIMKPSSWMKCHFSILTKSFLTSIDVEYPPTVSHYISFS